jgi:uncharacterized membrane protein YcjF (UPF0283 family)
MMSDPENNPVLGDPLDAVAYQDEPTEEASSSPDDASAQQQLEKQQAEPQTLRQNETGLGEPDFEPTARERERIRSVPQKEIQRMYQEQDDLEAEFEKKFQEMQQSGVKIPRFIYSFVLWGMVFFGAVLGLFIVNQGIIFFVSLSSLSAPWSLFAKAVVFVLVSLIAIVVAKIFKFFILFKKNTKVDLKALNVLNERGRLRAQVRMKSDEARRELTTYLKSHAMDENHAIRLCLAKDELRKLKTHRENLLGNKAYLDSSQWLNEFDSSIVSLLDIAAKKRIGTYAKSVALGTAASPIKLIDQLIVMYASFSLISELMRIYNLKPAFGQSAAILARSIVHAYLSGAIGEHIGSGFESVAESVESVYAELGMSGTASVGSGIMGAIAPKVAEGGLNGLLIWRLGKQAQKLLRPL